MYRNSLREAIAETMFQSGFQTQLRIVVETKQMYLRKFPLIFVATSAVNVEVECLILIPVYDLFLPSHYTMHISANFMN